MATVWVTEVKSRRPRDIAYPAAAKPMPSATPISSDTRNSPTKLAGLVKISITSATSRPVEMPDCNPWVTTVPQLRRPSTRSTDFRSVPTMARFCTSNFSSAR